MDAPSLTLDNFLRGTRPSRSVEYRNFDGRRFDARLEAHIFLT
jgi:hypothetical protein